jgi:aromatic-L-amino-acid decarboxylase
LELITLNWLAKMFGLSSDFYTTSETGGGIILGTASEVAITVAVAARERALAYIEAKEYKANGSGSTPHPGELSSAATAAWRGEVTSKFVMYGTTQTHSIGLKAATVLGLTFRAIEVSAKDAYSLRGDQLQAALDEDIRKGLIPFMLIATVGTTSSGAVDNLPEIQQVGEWNGRKAMLITLVVESLLTSLTPS